MCFPPEFLHECYKPCHCTDTGRCNHLLTQADIWQGLLRNKFIHQTHGGRKICCSSQGACSTWSMCLAEYLARNEPVSGLKGFERLCNGGLVPLHGKGGARHETHCQHLLGKLRSTLCCHQKWIWGQWIPKLPSSATLSEAMGQAEGCPGRKNKREERGAVNLNTPVFSFPRFTL